ncbi:tRNA (N(6)-L-threonylcarbamoyladenosine(37)-C(2))-methylthiotransferase MtaB [bacterium]|nr:tRNA (N(6)-L-threonylcarbamoyladenosine(37)-C(2))-methylthiotransferase MtaB [bacterium]
MNTYQVHFLGCKASLSDAMGYAGILQRAGWKEAAEGENVSLVLIQTCTVTMSADAQGRQMVRKLKSRHPSARILLTGCYAQRAEEELTAMPEVDYVIGNLNPNKRELFSKIANASRNEDTDFPMPGEFARTRPFIKIQDGCDARCSYCIIPAVRGKSRSLPVEEVVRRVELFRDRGYQEMILTGISMGGYGKDLNPKSSLSHLMSKLHSLPGNFRIRLSSIEPEEVDEDFLDIFTSSDRFQPHLHLPIQSASDQVLKKMRRQYLFRRYDWIVKRLFAANARINLGTDILVGFPEEDSQAFEETYQYVQNAPFAYCHVFPFSPRPDTPAASYRRESSHAEVTERAAKLRDLAHQKNLQYRSQFVGEELSALLLHGTGEALTGNYIRVEVPEITKKTGFVSIRIHSVDGVRTHGAIVQ